MNLATKMIVVLSIMGLLSGGALASVYKATYERIKQNQLEELKKAIFIVLSDAKNYKKIEKDGVVVYKGLDKDERPAGLAFKAKGMGFQGEIGMMVGMDNSLEKLKGLFVLDQLETPGLGAKITTKNFQDQFKGLAVNPEIIYVKNKKPSKPNEIQAITAATISSKAVVNILNKDIKKVAMAMGEGD